MGGFIYVKHPEILHIKDFSTGGTYYGADQLWYGDEWKRKAGCGPTTCSNMLWYLSRTRSFAEALCPYDAGEKNGFIKLMDDVWNYVTPSKRGVNTTDIFTNGAVSYGADAGVELSCEYIKIESLDCKKRKYAEIRDFLYCSIENDIPVGFLNLSNGELKNLDNWHWVTLIGVNADASKAVMYDQKKRTVIEMELWYNTTLLGGGFVKIIPVKKV